LRRGRRKSSDSNDYTLEELKEIKDLVLGQVEFLDSELDNPQNTTDLEFERTKHLRQYEICSRILTKTVEKIKQLVSSGE
jgi:hypothetical protein